MTERGRIRIDLFTTLDGVAQAPGGQDEDPSNGFPFGGWQMQYEDDVVGERIMDGMSSMDALLLGRRTYDIFAAYWPLHADDAGGTGQIGTLFNTIPKYVASRSPLTLDWNGSTRLGDDLAGEVDALRDRHRDVHVIGSLDFAQTLFSLGLWDELNLWMYPVVLGRGKRVFQDGVAPQSVRLTEPPVAGSSGAISLRYAPAGAVALAAH